MEPRLPRIGSVDAVALEERAATLAKRSIKKESKVAGARARDVDDGPDDARGQRHARQGRDAVPEGDAARTPVDVDVPSVAAVCVYPNLVPVAKQALRGSTVKVAASRPRSRPASRRWRCKLADVRERGRARARTRSTWSSTAAPFSPATTRRSSTRSPPMKEACGAAHLKVILETGELGTYDNVRRASRSRCAAGGGLHQDLDRQGLARRRRCR